jgi:hypothetical protein
MEKWKDCNQVRVATKTSNEAYGDDNEEFHIDYYCPECMARQWNCSPQSRIRDTQPHVQKRRWQQQEFAEADKKAAEAVPGASKGERRMITKDSMKGAIAPIARFVLLKAKVLRERGEVMERHTALINKMKATKRIVTITS